MGATPQVAVRRAGGPEQVAGRYAQSLLAGLEAALGVKSSLAVPALELEHPAATWARSGLMALTGEAGGEPAMCPVPLASQADATLAALGELARARFKAPGSSLLAVRAAIAGHSRRGRISPGGSCRLLEARDGRIALNLAREDDWELLPAWLEADCGSSGREAAWRGIESLVRVRPVADLVARGRMMGLAIAPSELQRTSPQPWLDCETLVAPRRPRGDAVPRVIDLSSLWAGPLCAQLLRECGAEVIKVESIHRADGARRGPQAFFDLLNAGKSCVALDLRSAHGVQQLKELIAGADIVIEASRPRALRQLGIAGADLVRHTPGLTWVSITGYGRGRPEEDWVAFGDDAGVAAGLSEVMREATGEAMLVGDAIADPLTGLHAALAAWGCWISGGGRRLSLSLANVVRHCINFDCPPTGQLQSRQQAWTRIAGTAARPAAPPVSEMARALGADNAMFLE